MQRIIELGFLMPGEHFIIALNLDQTPRLSNRLCCGYKPSKLVPGASCWNEAMSAVNAEESIAGIQRIQPKALRIGIDFVCAQPRAHLLQLSAWGALKSQFDWDARIVALGNWR